MGVALDYVQADKKSGRLSFRRVYPPELRRFIPGQPIELKRTLASTRPSDPEAIRRYQEADTEWRDNVAHARKVAAGAFDRLDAATISRLADAYHSVALSKDDAARWAPGNWGGAFGTARWGTEERERWARLHRGAVLHARKSYKRLSSLGDVDSLLETWAGPACSFAESRGILVDPTESEPLVALCRALNDAAIRAANDKLRRHNGEDVPTPPLPEPVALASQVPEDPLQSFQAIIEGLLNSERNPISATTKEGTKTALRLFRELHGTPTPREITRAMVADWLDMLAKRPAKLPKEHRSLPLPELVKLYEGRSDVPRLSPKTIAQHLSMLSARWPQARRSGRIGQDLTNPFEDHDLERARKRRTLGFSADELKAIFGLPIWTAGERPLGGKGEASYWLPLLLLFTGARPEEAAQLLVSDVLQDPETGRWLLRITDEGEHPHKGRQSLKTSKGDTGRRTFPIPQPLLDLNLLTYVKHLQERGETALFPRLRVKGARNLLFAGFGDWWGKYLRRNHVQLEGTGRQPARETRHTWSTAARRSGIPREAMAYIQGHALPDATAGEGYGDLNPLGLAIEKLQFPGFDTSAIRPWVAPKRPYRRKASRAARR